MTSSLETKIQPESEDTTSVDDWENADGEIWQEQLQERFKQVKILERAKADKDALLEKARQDEAMSKAAAAARGESSSLGINSQPTQMQILRRPKSSDQLEEIERTKKEEEERERATKKPTLEERQAAYELARNRILGEDYKPEPTIASSANSGPSVSRNRSPETITTRRRGSPEILYPSCYSQTLPPQCYPPSQQTPQQYSMINPHMIQMMPAMSEYNSMTLNPNAQPFIPFVDTSRPPPLLNPPNPAPNYSQQIPTFHTGQYLGGGQVNSYSQPAYAPPSQYGRPPLNLYPPGSLAMPLQVKLYSGQSQRQQRNKNNKKKKKQGDTSS